MGKSGQEKILSQSQQLTVSELVSKNVVNYMGVNFNCLTMDQLISVLEEYIKNKIPQHVLTADAASLVMAWNDSRFKSVMNAATLVIPDSMGIVHGMRYVLGKNVDITRGIEVADRLFALSSKKGYRIFLLGSSPGIAEKAAANIVEKYPNCKIVGSRHGYFQSNLEAEVVKEIKDSQPDILLVAMGMPRQEIFINKYITELNVPVCLGIGGSLDVYSGNVMRAPKFIQNIGLEWLWRFTLKPSRYYKVKLLPKYLHMVLSYRNRFPLGEEH